MKQQISLFAGPEQLKRSTTKPSGKKRLLQTTMSIFHVIKKNKLALFSQKNTVLTKKTREKISSLKEDCNLYASIYVACQTRESDLDDFFAHENHSYPPALSVYGMFRHTDKSECLTLLSKFGNQIVKQPVADALILD